MRRGIAGSPLHQGAARVVVEATVKDTSGHSESRGEPVMVSDSPLLITVVPESGSLVPGLKNRVYILTSYPDGTPAESDVRVEPAGNAVQSAATDKGGIAIVSLSGGATSIRVKARDSEGNQASVRAELGSRESGSDQVLLRAERAVYRAGEPIRLEILATRQNGPVYLDVVKNGQTIGTHDVDIINGRAALELAATPDMTGTVEFHAFLMGPNAIPIGDRRLVFVQPANELRIETSLDAPVEPAESSRRDRAAQALFAAAQSVAVNDTPSEFGRTAPQLRLTLPGSAGRSDRPGCQHRTRAKCSEV